MNMNASDKAHSSEMTVLEEKLLSKKQTIYYGPIFNQIRYGAGE